MEKHILEQLYKRYTKPLYLYLFSLCHNREVAEDLMQETFLKAFCNLEYAREEMLPWLFRVAKNFYIDFQRKEKCTIDYESVGEISAEDREVLEQLIVKEQNRKLYEAICRLKEPEREIVILYYFGGLSQNEIAKQLNLSGGNLRVILHRAKRKLYDDILFEDENESEEAVKFQKAVSKEVNRKIFTYTFAAVFLMIVLIDIGRTYMPLWVSRMYYTPFKYQDVLYSEDFYEAGDVREFKKSIETYRELFYGAKGHLNVHETRIKSEGYGVYDMRFTVEAGGENYQYPLKLKRNKLENLYWGMEEIDWFDTGITEEDFQYPTESVKFQEDKSQVLSEVGEKDIVRVAISFDSLKDMEQIQEFMVQYEGDYLYVPLDVKTGEGTYVTGVGYDPQRKENVSEKEIVSKFSYLMMQNEFNKVFHTEIDMENAQDYLNKNGVKGYGAVVCMDKEQLENVMTANDVTKIKILQ